MKSSGKVLKNKVLMLFFLVGVSVWVIISARQWPPKSALFPQVISSFVLILSLAELCLTFFGKGESGEETDIMDFKLSNDLDKTLVNRRIISILLWIIGFTLGIFLLGFPITTPLFMFLYLKFDGKEGWGVSISMTIVVWMCFYFLFIWFMKTHFAEGLIIEWLKGG
jgi:hypothetical protein